MRPDVASYHIKKYDANSLLDNDYRLFGTLFLGGILAILVDPVSMLLGEMRRQFLGHFLQRQHGVDATEFASREALAIFFQKNRIL